MNEYSDLEKKLGYIDITPNKKYLYRICQMYDNNEATIDELVSVFHERAAINSYLTTDDVEGKDIITLSLENDKGSFRKRWYFTKEQLSSWENTIIYEDEFTTVNKPTSFEESKNIGNPIWCFCYNEDWWKQHTDFDKETIYFVHSLLQDELNYCAACVLPNGDIKVLDKNHHWLSRNNGELYMYLYQIKDARNALKSESNNRQENKDNINCNNVMKTNNKKVVRLTESKLTQIVAESVRKVLKEWDSDDDFVGHGYKTTSNLGGNEIQISDSGDAARLKFPNGRITDWLEIEFDEEGVAYITPPDGDMERLDEYMRFR